MSCTMKAGQKYGRNAICFPFFFGAHELQYGAPKVNYCVVLQCDTHRLVGSHQSTDVQML